MLVGISIICSFFLIGILGIRTFNFQRFPVESLPFQDFLSMTSTNDTRTIESFQPFIVNVKSEQGTI